MRKLILRASVSIDGILESSDAKIDFAKTRSPEGAAWLAARIAGAGAHLLGRKAFSQMAPFWPTASGPVATAMNEIPKIVFSRHGFDPSSVNTAKSWSEARVLTGDLATEIASLKQQNGGDLIAHGGVEFVQHLAATGLVDEFWLATHPLIAGRGHRLFDRLSEPLYFKLVSSTAFASGAMAQVYRPEGR